MIIYLSLLVAIIGVFMFFIPDGKLSTFGLATYCIGFLVFLSQLSPHMVSALK